MSVVGLVITGFLCFQSDRADGQIRVRSIEPTLNSSPDVASISPAVSVIDASSATEALPFESQTAPCFEFPVGLSVPFSSPHIKIATAATSAATEIIACQGQPGHQNILLRKNVLGCKACYTIPSRDEIWIVSVRDCVPDPENVALFKVLKLESNRWKSTTLSALTTAHQCDTQRATMMYVHGNQTNYEYAIARGFQFYNNLFVDYDGPRAPLRLVLWVWKSERELPRLYPDYLIKSERAVLMGKTLTKTLQAMGNRKLAVVGFSLGAQVVMSSLEQLEPNCQSASLSSARDQYQIALIAPATDPAYVCDVIDRNVETSIVEKSTVIVNSDDRAVKAMRVVVRRECPEARDRFSKLARCRRLPLGPIEFFEVSQEISRKHAIERYTKAPTVQRAMNRVLNRVAAKVY